MQDVCREVFCLGIGYIMRKIGKIMEKYYYDSKNKKQIQIWKGKKQIVLWYLKIENKSSFFGVFCRKNKICQQGGGSGFYNKLIVSLSLRNGGQAYGEENEF